VALVAAGLEDYARPIIDAIDPQRRFFAGRIYREGTLRTDYYQCVKVRPYSMMIYCNSDETEGH
jgi:RNA polymerase II subunit A small phosphatase-like protein